MPVLVIPAISSLDSTVTVVNSVSVDTSATGNGGFAFSTGTSRIDVLGTNVTGATGLRGGRRACLVRQVWVQPEKSRMNGNYTDSIHGP